VGKKIQVGADFALNAQQNLTGPFRAAENLINGFSSNALNPATVALGAFTAGSAAAVMGLVAMGRTAANVGRSLVQTTNETAELGSRLHEVAARVGSSVEALGAFEFAAESSGIAARTFDMALQRLTRRMSEAAVGTGEAQNAIKELGLDAKALADLPTEEVFLKVAGAIAGTANEADRLRLAFKFFDSEGAVLVQTLDKGIDGFVELMDTAKELGGIIGEDLAAASKRYTQSQTEVAFAIQGLKNSLARELLPTLTRATDTMVEFILRNRPLVDELTAAFGLLVESMVPLAEDVGTRVVEVIDKLGDGARSLAEDLPTVITAFQNLDLVLAELGASANDSPLLGFLRDVANMAVGAAGMLHKFTPIGLELDLVAGAAEGAGDALSGAIAKVAKEASTLEDMREVNGAAEAFANLGKEIDEAFKAQRAAEAAGVEYDTTALRAAIDAYGDLKKDMTAARVATNLLVAATVEGGEVTQEQAAAAAEAYKELADAIATARDTAEALAAVDPVSDTTKDDIDEVRAKVAELVAEFDAYRKALEDAAFGNEELRTSMARMADARLRGPATDVGVVPAGTEEQVDQLMEKLAQAQASLVGFGASIRTQFVDGVGGSLQTMIVNIGDASAMVIKGTKSLADAAAKVWQSFTSTLISLLTQLVVKMLVVAALQAYLGMGNPAAAGQVIKMITALGGTASPVKEFHKGGMVEPEASLREEVPAMLLTKEAILNRGAVQALGEEAIRALNASGASADVSGIIGRSAPPEPPPLGAPLLPDPGVAVLSAGGLPPLPPLPDLGIGAPMLPDIPASAGGGTMTLSTGSLPPMPDLDLGVGTLPGAQFPPTLTLSGGSLGSLPAMPDLDLGVGPLPGVGFPPTLTIAGGGLGALPPMPNLPTGGDLSLPPISLPQAASLTFSGLSSLGAPPPMPDLPAPDNLELLGGRVTHVRAEVHTIFGGDGEADRVTRKLARHLQDLGAIR
jgi:hypothetical protein